MSLNALGLMPDFSKACLLLVQATTYILNKLGNAQGWTKVDCNALIRH